MSASAGAAVVIAARDAARTLPAQLDALAAEPGDDVEILVCDNGSRDDTRRVVETARARDERLRLVDASMRPGPSAARNTGAAASGAPLLLFCDADDVIAPGWIAALRASLAQVDLVAGTLEGKTLNVAHRASVSWEVSGEIRMPFWPRYGAGASSNLGIRSAVFAEVGGFDESLRTGEDVDLCWRVQLSGHTFGRTRAAIVHSRQRDGRRAVFRQARSYGAGSRTLAWRYRDIIAAEGGDLVPAPFLDDDPPPVRIEPPRAGFATRVRRLGSPRGQADLAWRTGEWVGRRFGRIDPAVTTVKVTRR